MPYGDGTGPMGRGPMTGRGFGWCNGRGGRFGRGFGFREPFYKGRFGSAQPVISREDELRVMEREAAVLEEEKRALQQEIERLKKELQERQ